MSEENKEYLVRGAQLVCNMGSHIRRYNLPESHGAYVMNHPLVTKTDVGPDNIKFLEYVLVRIHRRQEMLYVMKVDMMKRENQRKMYREYNVVRVLQRRSGRKFMVIQLRCSRI